MLTKKKIGIIAVCLVLLSSIMLGCIERETLEPATTTQVEQVLTQGSYRDFKAAAEGRRLVFETFLGVDENGNPMPGLAESWEISPDGKTYTFYLRKGVKFHDGTPFNASVAKFSIEWSGKKKTFGKYIDRIEIVDDYTLRVYLKSYYYLLLGDLGVEWTSKVISPNAVEPAGDVNGKLVNYIGTGPFKLVDYKKDQEAVLVRNDDYWGKKPKLEKVIWKTVPDPYTQVLALKAGELDLIGAAEHHSCLPYIEIAKLQEDPDFEVMLHSYGRYQVIDFNFKREPFTDVRVRKAFNYAIDRELMVHTLFADLTNPAYLLGPPAPDWGPHNIDGYSYDPEKAKQLLTGAGWRDTDGDGLLDKGGKPFTCELLVPSGEANADVVSVFVQSELKKIGVQMKVTTLESGTAWDMRKKGEYDLFVHHCCGAATMACLGIGGKYHSAYGSAGVYHSDELDKLIEKAFTSLDKTERRNTFDHIWEILHEEAPSIPLYDITKPVIFRKNVRGFKLGPTMFEMDLSDVEIVRYEAEAPTPTEQVLTQASYRDFKRAQEGRLLVVETLVSVDESGNPSSKLVESWDVSPDGKTYTFHLRKGVKFHDGTPFNAEAAKFCIEWSGGRKPAYRKFIDRMEIIDDYTLRVHLNSYYYPFLLDLASGWNSFVVSPNAVEPAWDPNGKLVEYIGTGPFKLVDYKKDQEAVLVRNDDYWGKKPKLEKVIWKTVPDPYTQVLALKAGELDLIGAAEHHSCLPYIEIAELQKDPNLEVMLHSYGRYQVIRFNCEKEPFNDVRVRKAFNYALDKELMVHTLFADIPKPAYRITDPKFKWGPSNIDEKYYQYDPDKAKQLLAEASWADTDGDGVLDRDGKPFTCELIVPAGEANADVVAPFMQSELKKLGIPMNIITLESGAAGKRQKEGEYGLYVHHSGCLPSVAGYIEIGGRYHAGGWPHGYQNDTLDKLIEKAWTTPDEAEWRELCDQIWEILHEEAPCIPLYDITKPVVFRKNVHGFKFGPTMFEMDLSDMEVER